MSEDDLALAWSRCVQAKPRSAREVLGTATPMADRPTDTGVLLLCKVTPFIFQVVWMTRTAKPDEKAPCDWSARFRSAQWQLLICCLLSRIAQMLHPAARESLRHLSAMSL